MTERKRRGLSAEQKAELWKRWKAGQSLNEIGRALGKNHLVIQFLLARSGGIAPAQRRRSRQVLTWAEREDLSRGIASGCSMRFIAQGLRRAPSTVSREVARQGGPASPYRANDADQQAWQSALRPKPGLLTTHADLREIVAGKLRSSADLPRLFPPTSFTRLETGPCPRFGVLSRPRVGWSRPSRADASARFYRN